MSEILLDEQSAPATPAAGQMFLYPDSSTSGFVQKNDAGVVQGDSVRAAIAQQTGFAADTYVTNSGLIIPSSSMQAGMFWEWKIPVSKTAAGIATPIYQVRIGPNQTTADTSRLSITGVLQSAAADNGMIVIIVTCRSVGASGVLQGFVHMQHNLATTGLASGATSPAGFNMVEGTAAGFDNTNLGGQFIGLSINGGGSAAWTINQVIGRIYYG